jgi:hypothetical protein
MRCLAARGVTSCASPRTAAPWFEPSPREVSKSSATAERTYEANPPTQADEHRARRRTSRPDQNHHPRAMPAPRSCRNARSARAAAAIGSCAGVSTSRQTAKWRRRPWGKGYIEGEPRVRFGFVNAGPARDPKEPHCRRPFALAIAHAVASAPLTIRVRSASRRRSTRSSRRRGAAADWELRPFRCMDNRSSMCCLMTEELPVSTLLAGHHPCPAAMDASRRVGTVKNLSSFTDALRATRNLHRAQSEPWTVSSVSRGPSEVHYTV